MESNSPDGWQQAFLHRNSLRTDYLAHAQQWFDPLAGRLCLHRNGADKPVVLGLNGCQGSGKSTFSDYLASLLLAEYGLHTAVLSLDDFYLTATERSALAEQVHPLFATRGVPGTHDTALLTETLAALRGGEVIPLPRFDKAADDRLPLESWPVLGQPADIIVLEGWCLGATAVADDTLIEPVNDLERTEDSQAIWRIHVNAQLRQHFPAINEAVDHWAMFQAPSFDCVYRWRLEQEDKLRRANSQGAGLMSPEQVARFIQHFQRLTEHCLTTLPQWIDDVFVLDADRNIIDHRRGEGAHG